MSEVAKQPSAFLPVSMSLAALATVVVHIAVSGLARQADEGVAARLWQVLMAGQLPIVAWFAIMWLPRNPRQALLVLAVQAGAAPARIRLLVLAATGLGVIPWLAFILWPATANTATDAHAYFVGEYGDGMDFCDDESEYIVPNR